MFKKFFKKSLKPKKLIIFFLITSIIFFGATIVYASLSYRSDKFSSLTADLSAISRTCKVIYNNGSSGYDFFVPANTAAEWDAFAAHLPLGVTLGNCAVCGNNSCEAGEAYANCPQDCKCGNGVCDTNRGETAANCSVDCSSTCGNGTCAIPETIFTCPQDCPACGNLYCSPGETYANCPADCPPVCRDSICACPANLAFCEANTSSIYYCPADCKPCYDNPDCDPRDGSFPTFCHCLPGQNGVCENDGVAYCSSYLSPETCYRYNPFDPNYTDCSWKCYNGSQVAGYCAP